MIFDGVKITIRFSFVLIIFLLLISGCGDEGVPTKPEEKEVEKEEDWSFPSSSKFAITLYADEDSVAVGDSFDVKIILYNVDNVFGMALEIFYDGDIVDVSQVTSGPHFFPDSSMIMLSKIEPDSNRVSYGVSYVRGSGKTVSGSGVVAKLKCVATNRGIATFRVIQEKLEILEPDGKIISNFNLLKMDSATVIVE